MASAAFTGGATFTLADGTGLNKTASGKFLVRYEIGLAGYLRNFYGIAGVNGQYSKLLGFRERQILMTAHYVGASENDVIGAIQTDLNALASQSSGSTLALGGQTFYGVFLEEARAPQVKSTGLPEGQYEAEVEFTVVARRLS